MSVSARRVLSGPAGVVLLVMVLMGAAAGVAYGVVGGKTVSIKAAPWTVLLRAPDPVCTGVIIDATHVLTAEHCMMVGESDKPEPVSAFTVEAGVSNYNHPLASDAPQIRAVSAERLIPGFIASSKVTWRNELSRPSHDLAVLTLRRPLDLSGDDAKAAYLPASSTRVPGRGTRLVMAGFGDESAKAENANGELNEVAKTTVLPSCGTGVLCVMSTTGPCSGDSGAGLVEPGPHPTVIGILSLAQTNCNPGIDQYAALYTPAILRFLKTDI